MMKQMSILAAAMVLVCGVASAQLSAPFLRYPTAPKSSPTPSFYWQGDPAATWTEVWIGLNGSTAIDQWVQTVTTYTVPQASALTVGQTYQVWLRSWAPPNTYSSWSTPHSFTVGKVHNLSISPSDVRVSDNTQQYHITSNCVEHTAAMGMLEAYAPIHLPDGAVIVQLTSYWSNSDTTQNMGISLGSADRTTGNNLILTIDMASADTTLSNGTPQSSTDTLIFQAAVDNVNLSYALCVTVSGSGNGTITFNGALLQYVE